MTNRPDMPGDRGDAGEPDAGAQPRLEDGDVAAFRALGDEVEDAYRAGARQFMGVELFVAPGALVPRAETELLGGVACELCASLGPAPLVVDMCAGSGNLACAIASRCGAARVVAADLTDGAVAVARRNVDRLGLADRVEVLQGDLFAPLEGRDLEGRVDLVVCNPPYISSGRLAERPDLTRREPREAFDGGPYGLSIQQRVVRDAARFLRPGGLIAMELGAGQARQVTLLVDRTRAYEPVVLTCDAAGEPRVAVARKKIA